MAGKGFSMCGGWSLRWSSAPVHAEGRIAHVHVEGAFVGRQVARTMFCPTCIASLSLLSSLFSLSLSLTLSLSHSHSLALSLPHSLTLTLTQSKKKVHREEKPVVDLLQVLCRSSGFRPWCVLAREFRNRDNASSVSLREQRVDRNRL